MSTRSCIYVYGGQGTDFPFAARLYRHSDGYPSSNLVSIANAASVSKGSAKSLAQALLVAGERIELEVPRDWVLRPVGGEHDGLAQAVQGFIGNAPEDAASRIPERASCAWIVGWTEGLQDNIRVAISAAQDPNGTADPWVAPSKDDLAAIPLGERLDVRILGKQGDLEWIYFVDVDRMNVNVYGGRPDVPTAHVARGGRDPMLQLTDVLPQYLASEADAVKGAMSLVEKAGWTLNAAQLGIEVACAADARRWDELDEVAAMLPPGMPMASPAADARARFDGVVLKAGESWVLQRVPDARGAAFFVHDRSAFQPGPISEGAAYSVNYLDFEKTKAVAAPLASAPRRSGPGLAQ